jgi:cytochrome c oxidase cbb3-type subunit I/II
MKMNLANVALGAGVACISLAVLVQGVLPFLHQESRTAGVTRVVRTDLGELKWIAADATDYTPLEKRGRAIYIREGCWYCHSQFVRPVTGETRRWGPVSQAGEYAFDVPHLFSTRRIGPDLTRVGLKFSDEWHIAHFWDPRMLEPDSIMPRFLVLFDAPKDRIPIVTDNAGNKTLPENDVTRAFFDFTKKDSPADQLRMTPNAEGLVFVPQRGKYPIIFTPNNEFAGESVQLVVTTQELSALIAYVQKLGTNRGNWRDVFEPQRIAASAAGIPSRSEEWIGEGKQLYEKRCAGCHGVKGDGNGRAATFMYKFRPRNFNQAVFKFRLVKSTLATDGDLMRTITRGVRGTAMPSWHMLPEKDRLAIIQYIKYELAVDRSATPPYVFYTQEPPGAPIFVGNAPKPSSEQVARGKEVWQQAKCWECHGQTGKGDGEKAATLKEDLGYSIRPADLTTGQFKSGTDAEDIFRTMTTGLSGTPMPSYEQSISEEDRWALSYYVLSLSAFKDPLTGAPLPISAKDRQALNDPALQAPTSAKAFALKKPGGAQPEAGGAWAERKGIEIFPSTAPTAAAGTSAQPN